jgi:hypothetical protein
LKLIYVAGPYRSKLGIWGVKRNIEKAAVVARQLWAGGFAVICPHMNTALMDGSDIPDESFLKGDLEILRRCDAIVMVGFWEGSEGASNEHEFACVSGIPAFYCDDALYLVEEIKHHFRAAEVA